MHNIKLTIAYDGTAYLGWQKTSMGPSIEWMLQNVLEQIFQQPIALQAASRTDAGVHAHGQVVNFFVLKPHLDINRLKISLNCLLPKDIAVLEIEEMPLSFHPTLDCCGKEYRYYVCDGTAQFPQHRLYSWHYPHSLQLDHMRQVIPIILGTHSFAAFCNEKKNANYKDFVRTLTEIEVIKLENKRLCIRIKGNNFLYKMARNIVGTMIYVGRGKIAPEKMASILESGDRKLAGVTAPAHGLFLHQVFY